MHCIELGDLPKPDQKRILWTILCGVKIRVSAVYGRLIVQHQNRCVVVKKTRREGVVSLRGCLLSEL